MSDGDALPPASCPNCREPMQTRDLEQNYHGAVRVDLCFGCAGIWFDHLGSVQLAPGAVIELFKEIHLHLEDARRPVASRLGCPRCNEALSLGFDLSRSGRFSYFRCLRGDGRFTPFFQFLREKQFVRSLTPAELQRVRAQVRQIRCSECGAPIDLEHSSECKYCHAPVSFLDPDAVEKALQLWSEAESRRRPDAASAAVGEALQHIQLPHAVQAASPGAGLGAHLLSGTGLFGGEVFAGGGTGLDLVALGIRAIGRLLDLNR